MVNFYSGFIVGDAAQGKGRRGAIPDGVSRPRGAEAGHGNLVPD